MSYIGCSGIIPPPIKIYILYDDNHAFVITELQDDIHILPIGIYLVNSYVKYVPNCETRQVEDAQYEVDLLKLEKL